jgi:serine/threonine protein kinase
VSSSRPAAEEPTRIGKFQIVQKLGAGAFGTVYKAQDPELGRFVAIKTIRLEGLAASQASLDDLMARFKREAQVAARLKHPNIVTIHEIGSLPGNSYLVMEYVDGVGLDRVIARSGKMSVERAAAIAAQVADALAYAQKHNVVHRDIKPANIMIEAGDHVKVTDFGIAKVTDSVDHLTATGSLLGTPSYMSPEQARGGHIDGRSDLFSVGCILYEMLAGQKAFRGESITALLFKIITEEPPPLRELDPTVSDEMIRIVSRALAKSPEARYQSGRELADDLLALTRPGFVPTLRATDVPPLPPDTPPAEVPTVVTAPTAHTPGTISSAPTAVRPGAGAPAPSPTLPPTILTPSTVKATPPPARPAAPRPAPAEAQAARRKGGGAGLVVGLGLAAVLGIAVVVAGGYFLFGRRAPAPTVATVEAPPPAESPATDVPPAGSAGAIEATPTGPGVATNPAPSATVPAATAPTTTPVPRVADGAPRRPPAAAPPEPPAPGAPPAGGAPETDYSFLDEPPAGELDGRAAGEALAQKYRSGGSTGYSTTRFRQRPKLPPGITMPERPAVATLLYLSNVQEAFHRKSGRYGTLKELSDAGLLVLDVPFSPEGFRRARYGFRVSAEAGAYRIDATPLAPVGRAFLVDDSGFVRLPDE